MKLNRTELKILVYRKCRQGISYEKAVEQVKKEVEHLKQLTKKLRKEKKSQKIDFKEEFEKLRNGTR